MELYVGQSSIRGELARYARNLNLLELLAEPSFLPKLTKLAGYPKLAPGLPFSVVLSPRCFDEPGPATTRALEYGLSVARALEARWLVVRTPPSLRPGPTGEKRLEKFVAELPKGAFQIAWDARGLWEMSMVRQVSARLGLTPVLDVSNVVSWGDTPIEGACYARLLGIGIAQRPSEAMLARLLERVIACEQLYLVVDGPSAIQTRQVLSTLLEELNDLGDDELDDGEELDSGDGEDSVDEDSDDDGEDSDDEDEDSDDEDDDEEPDSEEGERDRGDKA